MSSICSVQRTVPQHIWLAWSCHHGQLHRKKSLCFPWVGAPHLSNTLLNDAFMYSLPVANKAAIGPLCTNQRFAPNIARPNGWREWISIECFDNSGKSWGRLFVLNFALCMSGRAEERTTYAANGNLNSLHAFSESSRSANKLKPGNYNARYSQKNRESILAERKQAANHKKKRWCLCWSQHASNSWWQAEASIETWIQV